VAGRYRDRGEPLEDLVQAGTVGLIMAVDRFDITRGTQLSTFATPTVLGEIRRHFRDHAWAIRVPRGLQELQIRVSAATDEMSQRLHRAPTVNELADELGVSSGDVLAALDARHAYSPDSLDPAVDESAGSPGVAAALEPAFAEIEDRETLLAVLAELPERERELIRLRFDEGLTQSEIASSLGISQMHVSRLLARTLTDLRERMTRD
jgi:RNA polymerase sigma-B factor